MKSAGGYGVQPLGPVADSALTNPKRGTLHQLRMVMLKHPYEGNINDTK